MTTQDAITALEIEKLSESDQIIAMAWMQSLDPEHVENSISNGSAMDDLKKFRRWFPMGLSKPIREWCKSQIEWIDEGRVDVLPQPGGRLDAPKN